MKQNNSGFSGTLVISPVLNEERLILRCIESVKKQVNCDFFHFIGDNFSDDSTSLLVENSDSDRLYFHRFSTRESSAINWVRTIQLALELFPNASSVQMLAGDDFFGSEDYLTDLLRAADDCPSSPEFIDEVSGQIMPLDLPQFRLLSSDSTLKRATAMAHWDIVYLTYSLFPRSIFEKWFRNLSLLSRGDASADWRAMALLIESMPIRFNQSRARYVRNPVRAVGWFARIERGESQEGTEHLGLLEQIRQLNRYLTWPFVNLRMTLGSALPRKTKRFLVIAVSLAGLRRWLSLPKKFLLRTAKLWQ